MLANRLQNDLASLSLRAVSTSAATGGGGAGAAASQGLLVGQQLLAQVRTTKPVGRLVIDVQAVLKEPRGGTDDVLLKDGDKLIIPKKTEEITILGEVQARPRSLPVPGSSRATTTLRRAAAPRRTPIESGFTWCGRERGHPGRESHGMDSGELKPWKCIPAIPSSCRSTRERLPSLVLWQAITTIIYNLSVGAVLIHQYL